MFIKGTWNRSHLIVFTFSLFLCGFNAVANADFYYWGDLVDRPGPHKDFGELVNQYEKAISLEPDNARLCTDFGIALMLYGDFLTSRAAFARAWELDRKGSKNNLYFLALLDENQGNGKLALKEYQQYCLEAGTSGTYSSLAKGRIESLSKNINAVKRLREEHKDYLNAKHVYANAINLDRQELFDEAINAYEKAVAMNPLEEKWWLTLRDAKQRKAARLAEKAYFALKTANGGSSQAAQAAVNYLEEACETFDDANKRFNLAVAYQRIGNSQEALVNYKRTLGMDDRISEAHFELGMLYESQGETALAIAEYKKYLDAKPNGENARLAENRLNELGNRQDAVGNNRSKVPPTQPETKNQR